MRRAFTRGVAIAVLVAGPSLFAKASGEPIDVTGVCARGPSPLTYRCAVRVVQSDTGAPLCVTGATMVLELPSALGTRRLQAAELHTDANGEMHEIELKLPIAGDWRAVLRFGDLTVVRSLNLKPHGVSSW